MGMFNKLNFENFDKLISSKKSCYVILSDKTRCDNNLYNYTEAISKLKQGFNLGWLVCKSYIVIDIDNDKDAEMFKLYLEKLSINTLICKTPRGMHFYFKYIKSLKQSKYMLTQGIVVDVRCAEKGYVVLPYNIDNSYQITRYFINDNKIVDLPDFVNFLSTQNNEKSLTLVEEGNRNNTLYRHLCRCLAKEIKDEHIPIIANFTNKKLFKKALDSKEVENIVKSALSFKTKKIETEINPYLLYNAKMRAYKINVSAILEHYESRNDIFVLDDTGTIFMEKNGVYSEAEKELREEIKKLIDNEDLFTIVKVNECVNLIRKSIKLVKKSYEINIYPDFVNFKNGIYDIKNKQKLKHISTLYSTVQIPHNFEINSTIKLKDTKFYIFLKKYCDLYNEDIEMLLDYCAYCITTYNNLKVLLFLYGPYNSGKSTVINFLTALVGEINRSVISIQNIQKKFYATELFGKLINVCADDASRVLYDVSVIKSITGNDEIMYEKKGKNPTFFRPFVKLIYSFNDLPHQIRDKSSAFFDRLRVFYMPNTLRKGKDIPVGYIDNMLTNHVAEIIPHLLDRLPINSIRTTQVSNNIVKKLRSDSDTVFSFIDKKCKLYKKAIEKQAFLYETYSDFCIEDGLTPLRRHEFYRSLAIYGIKTKYVKERNITIRCLEGIQLLTNIE